eukprot:CAMPEP_0197194020 /NCGR_PEP_ID=MMETSP1423-20130617/28481_1 /TAXON_ID=476441 /ORGANISM="Pseudo-nitzschia heimii, Strain UNC1101" /LENGTH=1084 /DNA_ID=CAMNT_0042647373 /DNA_START=358 /DNA_END=3612 /DNA_ORIENTATION=+
MVHSWNFAVAVLLASSTTTPVAPFQSSSSNSISIIGTKNQKHQRRQRLPSAKNFVTTIATTKSSLTSIAADASSSFNNDKDGNIGDAFSSVTNAAVDSIANVVKDEPDVDAEEVARKQKMVKKRRTEKSYRVTLPLSVSSVSNIGIRLSRISKGRKLDADLELNLDTLDLESVSKLSNEIGARTQGKDIDMDIPNTLRRIDGEFQGLVVSSVREKSAAWEAGVRPGDILKSTSATLGNQMWPKSTLEGVISAISSRKAVSESMEFEFQHLAETLDNQFELTLTRPIGFNLKETEDGYVEVVGFTPKASKLARYAVQPGDRILAVDSSLGDRMWPVSTTEGLISSVTARLPGQKITFRFERRNSKNNELDTYSIAKDGENITIDSVRTSNGTISTAMSSETEVSSNDAVLSSVSASGLDENLLNRCQEIMIRYKKDEKYVNKFSLPGVVADKVLYALASAETMVDAVTLSMIMTAYISCRRPEMAIRVFEAVVGLRADGIKVEVESAETVNNINLDSDPFLGKNGKQIVPNLDALDIYTVGALLKTHAMNGDLVAMQRVLSILEGHGGVKMEDIEIARWPGTDPGGSLQPDTVCYNVAITAAANSDVEEGLELAKIIFSRLSDPGKSNRLAKDIVSYNSMIRALTKFGQFEDAIETFYRMKKFGIKPDKYTYTALAKAVMVDDNDVEELLYDMREEGVVADVMTFNVFIRYLCEEKRLSAARKVINFMEASGISPDSWTYGFLMNGLLESDNPSACLTLFESACSDRRTVGLTENVFLYTTAMTAAAALGDHTRALELLSRMNSLGIKPNLKTLTALLSACLAAGEAELAVDIYRRIPNPDSYAVTKGLIALSEAGRGDEALEMLSKRDTVAGNIQGKALNKVYESLLRKSIIDNDYNFARLVLKSLLGKGNIPSKGILQRIFESMSLTLKDGLVANISYSESGFVKRQSLDECDAEKFKFLLFLVDSLAGRNLPCESTLYTTTLQFGNHLGGLPRKIAALLVLAKAASGVYTDEKIKLIDERNSLETKCLVSGWEELYLSFDEIRNQLEGPGSLPKLDVRIASRDLSRVLKAEKNLSYRKRSLV